MRISHSLKVLTLVCFGITNCVEAQENVSVQKEYTAIASKEKGKKFQKKNFIANRKQWNGLWKELTPKAQAPKVDFKKSIVLYMLRDQADPNRMRVTLRKDNEGVVSVLAISTLIGFEPSNTKQWSFYVISREGIKGVRRYDRELRKQVVDPFPK